jgi:hypothetical protein
MRNTIEFKTLEKINNEIGEFEIGQVYGGKNPVYLRFGYWRKVDVNKLNKILGHLNEVVEDKDFDYDTGCKYWYKLK